MIILIDIGNTRTKYCTVNKKNTTKVHVISNIFINDTFFNEHFIKAARIIVASVGHEELTVNINAWCQGHKIGYQRVVSEKSKFTLTNGYQQPNKLGVDRWLAMIGSAVLFPNKNILIIDAGTATTVDLLAANGQHQGGWILAGISTLVTSVLAETAQVKVNDKEKESLAFGLNTSENVHNAAWAATTGAINLAVSQAHQQGLTIDEMIFTGGNGALLSYLTSSSLTSHSNNIIDDLVLKGLQAYI